ncbi:hypothetical protein ACIA8M_36785 [Streptomyces anulatus]
MFLRALAVLDWETGGSAWRTGSGIEFPSGSPDPDGSGHLFRLLTHRSPQAVHAHFEEDYGRPVPLGTVRHVLAGHPLTPEAACGLNPDALSDEALLRRIAADPEAEAYLACDGEFDLTRTDPIESIALPAGLPVEPVAGCNAGGTHYRCGPAGSDRVRPVLYTDSEGQASLIAESLAEALTLAIVLPSWHDALAGFRLPALNADYLEDNPDHPEVRDRLLAALRLPPATEPEVLARLLTTAARTVPDGFLPSVEGEEDAAFEPMLCLPAEQDSPAVCRLPDPTHRYGEAMTAMPDWMRPPRAEGCSRRTWTASPRFGPAHAGSSAGDFGVIDLRDL